VRDFNQEVSSVAIAEFEYDSIPTSKVGDLKHHLIREIYR
jgi:hypothetical protein